MDVPLVTIIVEDEWNCIADATAVFKTAANFSRSSWDWIGLYKVKKWILDVTLCSSCGWCSSSPWVKCCCLKLRCLSGGLQASQGLRGLRVGQAGGGWFPSTGAPGDLHVTDWSLSRSQLFFPLLPFHWLRQAVFQVTFTEEELPKGSGDFILGYYSNNTSTIVGVTEPFQVIVPRFCAVSASSSPALHAGSPTLCRSSSPPWVLTTALQTAPTSAPRTTAPWSMWRRAPRVPARAGANTEATAAAAAPAAPSRPRSKHRVTVLPPTHRRRSPPAAQQRAAALRPPSLRQKLKNQGRDAKPESVLCVTGHIKPTVVSLVHYIHSNVCFLQGKDTSCNAILSQEQPPLCPGGSTLTLPSVL